MRVKIVGSAAGGGFPQWNCADRLNTLARAGADGLRPRTQSCVTVSANGRDWVIINASPDLPRQIAQTPELRPLPEGPSRSSPIVAVLLTSAEVDHVAGLLSLRERQPFSLYATARVLDTLEANPIFNVLDRAIVPRRAVPEPGELEICDADGVGTGVRIETFTVCGKTALYLERDSMSATDLASSAGETIAVRLIDSKAAASLFYIPACAHIDNTLQARLAGAACVLFDGTLYTENEMIAAGVGKKTAARMGHLAMSGKNGAIAGLADVPISRRIFIHINNTNPVLDEHSAERRAVNAAGWEIAEDGMEISL
jgi:pyrroloquinoline quinone biosynthesis protein B